MKNVLLLGATGQTGKVVAQHLVQLSEIGLTLYVRDTSKIDIESKTVLEVFQGDVLDREKLKEAMQGQEYVVSCLNGVMLPMAKNICATAKEENVSRIIWLTGIGIHKEVPGLQGIMLNMLAKAMPDYVKAADTIVASGIDYTLIRAPGIINGKGTSYSLSKEGEKPGKGTASKKAIAHFIADMIMDKDGLGKNDSLGIHDA